MMRRRSILKSLSVGLPLTTAAKTGQSLDCVAVDNLPQSGLDEPTFVAAGVDKDVRFYWRPSEYFADIGYPDVLAVAVINGDQVSLNADRRPDIDDYVILHELAHTLGYRHEDDRGIVQPITALLSQVGDRPPEVPLKESTNDVVSSFQAYAKMEWTADDLGVVTNAYGEGETRAAQLGHAVTQFGLSGSAATGAYIKHSFDGFGGRFKPGWRPNPENVLAGHFYGLPTA